MVGGGCRPAHTTLGETGLIWFKDGKTGNLPAPDVAVVDSTGASDAFHDAFALSLAQSLPYMENMETFPES